MKRIALLLSVALILPVLFINTASALALPASKVNKTNDELLTEAIRRNQINSKRNYLRTKYNYHNKYVVKRSHRDNQKSSFVDGNANELRREGAFVTPKQEELRTVDRFQVGENSRVTFGKTVMCYYVTGEGNPAECLKRHRGISMHNHRINTNKGLEESRRRAGADIGQSWLRRVFRSGTAAPKYDFTETRPSIYLEGNTKRSGYGLNQEFMKQFEIPEDLDI